MTNAVPFGRWSSRNFAVARAEVQITSGVAASPRRPSRAERSRGVYIELLVRMRYGQPALGETGDERIGAGDEAVLADDDPVHVHEPAAALAGHRLTGGEGGTAFAASR
jgi:hypothetical protein